MNIIKVVGMVNNDTYANVHAILEDGLEVEIFIGGDCEYYFHKGKAKAFIKRPKPNQPLTKRIT